MARTVFLTLLLINLVMLAWIYLNSASRDAMGREPQRAVSQLTPERIRIVDALPSALPVVCQAYAGLAPADAEQLAKAWIVSFPSLRFNVVPIAPKPAFDVVIAGFASRTTAAARLAELTTLGVGDSLQVRPDNGAKFSLAASFADRFGAEAKQRSLVQKGVGGTTVLERTFPATATIEARGTAAALAPLAAQAGRFAPTSCSS